MSISTMPDPDRAQDSFPVQATHPAPSRWQLFGYCVARVIWRFLGIALIVLLAVSLATIVIWIGLVLTNISLLLLRKYAAVERRISGRILGTDIPDPHSARRKRGLAGLGERLTDPATWREMIWLLEVTTVGLALNLAAFFGYIVLPVGYWISPLLLRMDAAINRTLLEPKEAELRERISTLEGSRARSVDHSAAELRRIERDLHDGAQARLVAAGMDIGLAESLLDADPAKARELMAQARGTTRDALADLRSLVRGIHPPVLADRGLLGGIESLAIASPVSVSLDGALPGRPPAPVEAAFYFGIAEAMTNATKHSGAQTISIWLEHSDGVLHVQVVDDGVGGAVVAPGGGLAGIASRLEAFDGTLAVVSPHGGPTVVTMAARCELTPAEGVAR
ncbi:sensor histidine kinase [Nakamurella lactea]|uniref:sensor histidine kinase n=1 Tax=Nakamurella lactea TaxID=459515 RepID=UPI00041A86FA|nr:sensor domain-containing protein [Nakamurella lactea]